MIEHIDPDQPIPPEWRVRGADSDLHSIGLSLFKPQLHPNRRLLYHPLLVFIIILIIFCKCTLLVYFDVTSIKLSNMTYILLADLDYCVGTGHSLNLIILIPSCFTIGSQLINYYNY